MVLFNGCTIKLRAFGPCFFPFRKIEKYFIITITFYFVDNYPFLPINHVLYSLRFSLGNYP